MTFSGCDSHCKDTYDCDEYIASVHNVLNKLEGIMTAFRYGEYGIFVVDKSVYITRLDKTICIHLETFRGVQLSIAGSLFTLI